MFGGCSKRTSEMELLRSLTATVAGNLPSHAIPAKTRDRVIALAKTTYAGVNHTQMSELLEERDGIRISRSSVRRILAEASIPSPRRRRAPKHRVRRERFPQEGMLLQVDGSKHDWLEGRGPYLTLVGAIDDATGTMPFALFREQEDCHGYFLLLREIIASKGIPIALYSDRHGIFQRSVYDKETLEEQLSGKRSDTQFGRAMKELGIELILAQTPQAKGRVERLWGTLQDRLVSELRIAGANNIDDANSVLGKYLPVFNRGLGVQAAKPGTAYRQLPPSLDVEDVLCFKYRRKVANDNTVSFFGTSLQICPDTDRMSYARAPVEVHERLDGSIVVVHQGNVLAVQEAPQRASSLRARGGPRPAPRPEGEPNPQVQPDAKTPGEKRTSKPRADHPWRRPIVLTNSLNS